MNQRDFLVFLARNNGFYKVIKKKTNQECYLILCFVETFVLLWLVRRIILSDYKWLKQNSGLATLMQLVVQIFSCIICQSFLHSPAEKAEHHYYLKIYRRGMWLLFFNQSLETF
jgi:hypothetical protein